jgi:hypothetical protein
VGRIVSNFFISLDGVVERPDQWHFPYFDDAMGEIVGAGMKTTNAFLHSQTLDTGVLHLRYAPTSA